MNYCQFAIANDFASADATIRQNAVLGGPIVYCPKQAVAAITKPTWGDADAGIYCAHHAIAVQRNNSFERSPARIVPLR